MTNNHRHHCPNCGTIWAHAEAELDGDAFDLAHSCPRCGRLVTLIHREPTPPLGPASGGYSAPGPYREQGGGRPPLKRVGCKKTRVARKRRRPLSSPTMTSGKCRPNKAAFLSARYTFPLLGRHAGGELGAVGLLWAYFGWQSQRFPTGIFAFMSTRPDAALLQQLPQPDRRPDFNLRDPGFLLLRPGAKEVHVKRRALPL